VDQNPRTVVTEALPQYRTALAAASDRRAKQSFALLIGRGYNKSALNTEALLPD